LKLRAFTYGSDSMSKHKRVGDEKDSVGKAGSPPSGTENEKPRKGKDDQSSVPKVSKDDVGGFHKGKPLH
jgi:hypothetical protein